MENPSRKSAQRFGRGFEGENKDFSYNLHCSVPIEEAPIATETIINFAIKSEQVDTNLISDGYHTFGELYEHRIVIFMALCRIISENRTAPVWKSKKHSDGELAFGGTWFVLGIESKPGKQITYHLPMKYWDQCNFLEVNQAPEFDGHTSADVLERITNL